MICSGRDCTVKPEASTASPPGMTTVTVRAPSAASAAIEIAIDRLVGPCELIDAVTPVPLNVTPVAPDRFGPRMVAARLVPGAPADGKMDVLAGAATVKPLNGDVVPEGVVTVKVRNPKAASGAIVITSGTFVVARAEERRV